MFAVALQRGGEREQLALGHAVCRKQLRHARLALSDGAGLVERDYLGAPRGFKRGGGLEQDAVLCAKPAADHYCYRRCKAERAGAAYDQHRYRAAEREADCLPHGKPDYQRHERDGHDRRHEYAGHLIRKLRYRRLGSRRIADHADYLRQRRILADARCAAADIARLIYRRGGDAIPFRLIDRYAFAGQRRLVHGAAAFDNDAVNGYTVARAHGEHIAELHLLDRNFDLLAVAHEARGLGCDGHQRLERVGRLALGASLQKLADSDEREYHGGRLEVQLIHPLHTAAEAELIERIDAVNESRAGAEGNERVHIRRAVNESLEAADEESLVDDHDNDREQQLRQPHRGMTVRNRLRQRPAEHHVPHRDVHQRQQEHERGDEPLFERGRGLVGQRILGVRARLRRSCRALNGRAVARRFYRGNDGGRVHCAVNGH